jgi:CelD/BcsL family acetyltransferase involved in cellulose biosynthesis
VVRDIAGLTAMATEWDALVRSTARPSPFLLNDWVAAWWRHLGTGGTLSVVTAHRAGRLVAAAPLYVRRSRGLRVCRLLGGHESALGDVLAADDDADAAAAVMRRVEDLPFDYLDAFGMPSGSVLVRHAPPGALTTLERVEAPVMLMPDGWDAAYTAKTGSKKRNLHRRRLRQLGELGPLRWDVARTPEEVGAAIGPAFEIHARRWQGRPDGSTFGPPRARVPSAGRRALAADGYVRIVTLHVADRPWPSTTTSQSIARCTCTAWRSTPTWPGSRRSGDVAAHARAGLGRGDRPGRVPGRRRALQARARRRRRADAPGDRHGPEPARTRAPSASPWASSRLGSG